MSLSTTTIARIFAPVCLLLTPFAIYGLVRLGSGLSSHWGNVFSDSETTFAFTVFLAILIGLLFTLEYLITAIRSVGLLLPEPILWIGTLLYNGTILLFIVRASVFGGFSFRISDPGSILVPLWAAFASGLAWKALRNFREEQREHPEHPAPITVENRV